MTSALPQFLMAIVMLAAGALLLGGLRLLRTGDRTKGVLMLVCAAVMIANVLIWSV